MPFADVLHQTDALTRIQRALAADRLPHAYLLTGPPGVGKEMAAARLAQRMLCGSPRRLTAVSGDAPWTDACGACDDCALFAAGNHPDYHRIHRLLAKKHPDANVRNRKATELSVAVVRHFLIGPMGSRPARNRAKVFLVVEAERMNDEAQNALLKTLEEPPPRSYLFLVSHSPDAMLSTTRSRCQELAFRTLPSEFIRDELCKRRGVSPPAARFLAELSQGSLGSALRYAEAGLAERGQEVLAAVASAADDPLGCGRALQEMSKAVAEALKESDDDEEGETNVARRGQLVTLAMAATVLRDVQRCAVGHEPAAFDRPAVERICRRASTVGIGKAIRAVGRAEYHIRRSVNTGLIFDNVGLAMA